MVNVPWIAFPEDGVLAVLTVGPVDLRPLGIDAVIPRGFRCDGMSIPRLLRPAIGQPVDAIATAAAVVHDYLYRTPGIRHLDGTLVTRSEADLILRQMLIDAGYGRARSWLCWTGVRIFGGQYWQK